MHAEGQQHGAKVALKVRDLQAFEQALAKVSNAEALIAEMNARYPNAELVVALEIGAKVAKGEMQWG